MDLNLVDLDAFVAGNSTQDYRFAVICVNTDEYIAVWYTLRNMILKHIRNHNTGADEALRVLAERMMSKGTRLEDVIAVLSRYSDRGFVPSFDELKLIAGCLHTRVQLQLVSCTPRQAAEQAAKTA